MRPIPVNELHSICTDEALTHNYDSSSLFDMIRAADDIWNAFPWIIMFYQYKQNELYTGWDLPLLGLMIMQNMHISSEDVHNVVYI